MSKLQPVKRLIIDRENYLTLPEAVSIMEVNEHVLLLMKGIIGFRWDPDDPKAPLFHKDDLRYFKDQSEYRILITLDAFKDPNFKPLDDIEFVELWLIEKVERLCKQYHTGDQTGCENTSHEINDRLQEARS
ncbi:MAG: hypothetical protein U9Q77_02810 [Candidatus Marinimicrobia bacterium]|nr:hypothetical protein [Candidatus Neomarinimicrobiota bacterium]